MSGHLEPQNIPAIPGMGLEHGLPEHLKPQGTGEDSLPTIPGLNWTEDETYFKQQELANLPKKKIPFSRPVPKSFEMAWKENRLPPKPLNQRHHDDHRQGSNQNEGRDESNQNHPGNAGEQGPGGPMSDSMMGSGQGQFSGPNKFQGNGGPHRNMPRNMDDRRGPSNNHQMMPPQGHMRPPGQMGPQHMGPPGQMGPQGHMGRGGPRGPPQMQHQGPGGPGRGGQRGGSNQMPPRDEDFRHGDKDFRQQGPPDKWQREGPGFDPFDSEGRSTSDSDYRNRPNQGSVDEDLRFGGPPSRRDNWGDDKVGRDVDYRTSQQDEDYDQSNESWEDTPRPSRGRGRPNARGYHQGPPGRPGNDNLEGFSDHDDRGNREHSPHQGGGHFGPNEGMRKRTYDEGPGRGRGDNFRGGQGSYRGQRFEQDSFVPKFGRRDSPNEQYSGQRPDYGHSRGRGGRGRGEFRGRGFRGRGRGGPRGQ